MDGEAFQKLHPLEYFKRFAAKGVRPDARAITGVRRVALSTGTIGTASGSAISKLGNTSMVAGIQTLVTYPSHAAPKDGILEINVHLSALCSSKFHATRQSDAGLALSQFLRRAILGSGALDLSQLEIKEGSSVWLLRADVVCLDYDGNAADAALLALVGALKQLRLPVHKVQDDGEVTVVAGEFNRLAMGALPVSLTFASVDGQLITDPTADEEDLASTVATIVVTADGKLCGVHKPGGSALTRDELRACEMLTHQRVALVQGVVDESVVEDGA